MEKPKSAFDTGSDSETLDAGFVSTEPLVVFLRCVVAETNFG